jgi:uncharacterized membrane protein YjgN (DUF898 family)
MQNQNVHSLQFHGNGAEYAKIYFVNLALSILTLGIYSAWAKVRNKRYFYGNTSLNGSAFDYHGIPMQILKGRLLVIAALFVYIVSVEIVPASAPLFVLAFFVFLPWAILRSVQFNMQNTSYRQVRFGFDGKLSNMFSYHILLPIASAFTLFLLYPFALFQQKYYLANKSRFGQSGFKFVGSSKEFYSAYLMVFLTWFLAIISLILLIKLLPFKIPTKPNSQVSALGIALSVLTLIGAYAFFVIGGLASTTYIKTKTTNYIYNNLSLSGATFSSNVNFLKLVWIYVSNALLILLTLGIYIPWAHVRTVRYKLSCLSVYADDFDSHIAAEATNTKAVGEEFSDVMDIDVGL